MRFELTTEVEAPADTVWELLGPRFADIAAWADVVQTSRALDVAEVPPGLLPAPNAPVPGRETKTKVTLIEVLTHYDDNLRTLTFVGVGLPGFVKLARNTQSVVPVGQNRSMIVFSLEIHLARPFGFVGPILRSRMKRTFGGVQRDLKVAAEPLTV